LRPASDLRFGVVGCGYWGSKHARILHGLSGGVALAVIDPRADRLRSLMRTFPGVRGFSTMTAALPHIDAVVIATPPSTHVLLALEAIRARKHVLVEKPLAISTASAAGLVASAADANVVLMVGHTFEYNPAVRRLRELVCSGELGEIYHVDTARLNLGLYQSDVNVVYDLAPHDVSILNYVLGEQPVSVETWASRHAHRHHEDIAYLRLNYSDARLSANIHVSWLDPCKVRRVTAVGSRKMAVYNDMDTEERIRVYDKGVVNATSDPADTQPPMSYRYGDITSPFVESREPLAVQDEHFAECIATGKQPTTDGHNGLAVVQVLEAAQMSLEYGRPVRVTETSQRLGELWRGGRAISAADPS
jgi:predicted dehydrogenase